MTASTALNFQESPPNSGTLTDYLDTATAAQLLACSQRTVTNLIQRGHLAAIRLGSGRSAYRIRPDALLLFAEKYGHHDPSAVATDDQVSDFMPSAAMLLETRTPDGLRLISTPPDATQEG